MYDEVPEGFEVPVYQGPLKPKLLAGAPADFTLLMFGGFVLGIFYKLWAVLPLTVLLQGGAIWGTAQDEKWFQKILRVVNYKRYYKA
jgi:type IV secretory pathway TrbD component